MTTQTLTIRRTDGSLPKLWDRQVIFVANLLGLFFGNENEVGELRRQVGPLESYGGRLVPILGLLYRGNGPNTVVLDKSPAEDLLAYFRDTLHLGIPEIVTLPFETYVRLATAKSIADDTELARLLDRLQACSGEWLDGFVTDAALERMAHLLDRRTICPREASKSGNNKLHLHEHLAASGLPVFDTEVAAEASQVAPCLARLRQAGYSRAAIKAQIGASGIGLVRVDTSNHSDEIPAYLFFEGPCLVQGWMDVSFAGVRGVRSPSVQLFLDDDRINLYDLTEQILSVDSIHEGNESPPPWLRDDPETEEELFRQAEAAGCWLHRQGYRGTASVDFHVAERSARREVRICEVNARVTGATYPSVLARHFTPGKPWLMRNLRFAEPMSGAEMLDELARSSLLFRPGEYGRILPINFNSDRSGRIVKGQFLCLGDSTETVRELLETARTVLPVQGEFDRD